METVRKHPPSKGNEYILVLSVQYDASFLADVTAERNPRLMWWNSTNSTWEIETTPVFTTKKAILSEFHTVAVVLRTSKNGTLYFREDDAIGVEVLVESPNQDNNYVSSKAGCAMISLVEIYEKRDAYYREGVVHELTMNTCFDERTQM